VGEAVINAQVPKCQAIEREREREGEGEGKGRREGGGRERGFTRNHVHNGGSRARSGDRRCTPSSLLLLHGVSYE